MVCSIQTYDRAAEDGAQMCEGGPGDFRSDLVLVPGGHPDQTGADLTCKDAFKHVAERLPKSYRDMACPDLKAVAPWTEPDGNVHTAMGLVNGYATPCCGGPAQTRCVDGSNMCKNSADFQPTATMKTGPSSETSCHEANAYLTQRLPIGSTWSDVSCAELNSAGWVDDEGRKHTIGAYMDSFGSTCCGSIVNTRCGGSSGTFCERVADFRPDKVVRHADNYTCFSLNHGFSFRLPRAWNDMSCEDIRTTKYRDEDSGEEHSLWPTLIHMAAPCCGSFKDVKCVDKLMPEVSGCVGYQTTLCDGMGGLVTRDFPLSDAHCRGAHLGQRIVTTAPSWDPQITSRDGMPARFALDVCTSVDAESPIRHSTGKAFTAYVTCKNKEGTAPLPAGSSPLLLVQDGANRCSDSRSSFRELWGVYGNPDDHRQCKAYGNGCVVDARITYGDEPDSYESDSSYSSNYDSSYGSYVSSSTSTTELIARLRALLDGLTDNTEAVGHLHAKLAEVEAATHSCSHSNHGGTGVVAHTGPMEPLTCESTASGSGGVQFLPVSEMFKPGLEGRLADVKAKGGQMCFCR